MKAMKQGSVSSRAQRSKRGATTVALILVGAFFVILPLGLLGFEYARYTLLCSQLQSVTDAAALSGTAALASSPSGYSYTDLHNLAMDVAVQTFQQNSVLTTSFGGGNVVVNKNTGPTLGTPPLNTANINITLLDQTGKAVATDSKDAVTMQIQAIYSDKPVFASGILPIGNIETASAISFGGLPQLDLFLCFDVSGSMDDQTPIVLVNRQWNPAINTVDYKTVVSGKSIYDTFKPQPTGTALNALPPQNLSYGAYPSPSNSNPYIFSESAFPAGNLLNGLRGNQFTYTPGSIPGLPLATKYPPGTIVPEQGWPPGNFDPTNPINAKGNGKDPAAYANGFTDLVVPVPSTGGYDFSNIATCVEASRGNMESDAICLQSQGGAKINPILPPRKPGYYATYWSQVEKMVDPIAAARLASDNFFYTMNISSNAHFALSSFSDAAGTAPTSTWATTHNNADLTWTASGTNNFPVPLVGLDQTLSNYDDVTRAVDGSGAVLPLRPTGRTNIADSLHAAIAQLTDKAKARPQAKKAIILFTDGVPNLPVDTATAQAQAFAEASSAHSKGIPIYTIGLSQNAAIKPLEDNFLGDNKGGSGKGVAYISGNNAIYVSVTKSADLNKAFQTIARSLVVLQ
ncbi:MAG: VWA domain-containing protein [Cyanobacteria bacterium SZAS TMP-1]|nr:VWA domain-containing protein [Cyanobacteria bacterium SZAS TMP-1]